MAHLSSVRWYSILAERTLTLTASLGTPCLHDPILTTPSVVSFHCPLIRGRTPGDAHWDVRHHWDMHAAPCQVAVGSKVCPRVHVDIDGDADAGVDAAAGGAGV